MMAKLTSTWSSEVFETSWVSGRRVPPISDVRPIQFSIEFCGELNEDNTILEWGDIQEIQKSLENQFQDKTIIRDDSNRLKSHSSYFKGGVREVRVMPSTSIERFAEWAFHQINALIKTRTKSRVEVLSAKCFDGSRNYATYSRI